jgi:hypothetical protein
MHLFNFIKTCLNHQTEQITLVTKKFSLPFKIYGDSYNFDIAKSEYDKHITLSPTGVKEKGLNFKTTSVINSNTLVLITICINK